MTDENPDKLQRAQVKDSGDFVFICSGIDSMFKEGEEFVAVKRWPSDNDYKFMKRKALLIRGRIME